MRRHSLPLLAALSHPTRYAVVRGGYPLTAVDKEKNVALLKTKGGNMVAATQVCTPGREPAAWDGTVGIAAGSRPAWRLREAASSVAHEAGAKPPATWTY